MKTIWLMLILLSSLSWNTFAQAGGAQDCRLLVKSSALSPERLAHLKLLGFKPVLDEKVDFSDHKTYFKYLPTHVEFGFESVEKAGQVQFLQYFPHYQNNMPTHVLSLKAEKFGNMVSCEHLRKQQHLYAKNRKNIQTALGYFQKKTSMGEALIRIEQVFNDIRLQKDQSEKALAFYNKLLSKIRTELQTSSGNANPLQTHDQIRRILFAAGMKNYCKSQASLTQFLMERCGNCSGQTKMIMAVYQDLGLTPPDGWEFGAEVFKDHVRPVWVNYQKEEVLDLVYNKREKELPNPIMNQEGILRKSLEMIYKLRPALFMEADAFKPRMQAAYRFLPEKSKLDRWMSFVGMKEESNPKLPAMDKANVQAENSNDVTLFDVAAETSFSDGEVPERADLSGALANSSAREAATRGEGRPEEARATAQGTLWNKNQHTRPKGYVRLNRTELEEINSVSMTYTQAEERRDYNQMKALGFIDASQFDKYSYLAVKDFNFEVPDPDGNPSQKFVLVPLKIELGSQFNIFKLKERGFPVTVLTVKDSETFIRLEKSTTAEKYNWVFKHLSNVGKSLSQNGADYLIEFFASSDPVTYWADHEKSIRQAQEDLVQIESNVSQFHDSYTAMHESATDIFMDGIDRSFYKKSDRLTAARVQFYKTLENQHRQILEKLNLLSASDLRSFFEFFKRLPEMRPISSQTFEMLESEGVASNQNGIQVLNAPLSGLLGRMLFDEEFFYSTPLSEREKELYKDFFKKRGIVKRSVPIQLPQLELGAKCPPEGGLVFKNGFYVDCSPRAEEKGLGESRSLVELKPMILAGLLRTSGESIFYPSFASLIHYTWRDGNTQALKELKEAPVKDGTYQVFVASPNMSLPAPDSPYTHYSNLRLSSMEPEDLFWEFLDALLAPNAPVYPARQNSSLVSGTEFDAALAYRSERPKWLKWSGLLEQSYEFYLAFRAPAKRVVLQSSPSSVRNSPLAEGNSVYSWLDEGVPKIHVLLLSPTEDELLSLSLEKRNERVFAIPPER